MALDYLLTFLFVSATITWIGLLNLKAYYYYVVDQSRQNLPVLSLWTYLVKPDFNKLLHTILFLKLEEEDSVEIAQIVRRHNRIYSGTIISFILIMIGGLIPF